MSQQEMNQQQLITDTTRRILLDLCTKDMVANAEQGHWPAALWQTLEDNGLTLAGISEAAGGTGGELADSLLIIREAASVGAPLPLAETFIAGRLCELAGAVMPAGPVTVATGSFSLAVSEGGFQLSGAVRDLAFGPWCTTLVLVACYAEAQHLCLVPMADVLQADARTSTNMAGEPRLDVQLDVLLPATAVFASSEDLRHQLRFLGAATRSVMMAGAMTAMLELSVTYAMARSQFGRPIAQFQAIQQQLAVLAGEVAACQRAADSLDTALLPLNELNIAIAKARIGDAVSSATDIAHQVHGAMGYTMEHTLNLRSRRLWCWRDDYGNDNHWQQAVGRLVIAAGADRLWQTVTDAA